MDGHILHAYRQLKDKYKTARDQTEEVKQRIIAAQKLLEPLPDDYSEPAHPAELEILLEQQRQVEESFTELEEQVDELRARSRLQARKGQFTTFRDIPDSMMKPLLSKAAVLGGKVQKIENVIHAYRVAKVEAVNSGLRRLVNPLLKATEGAEAPIRTVEELQALSLHDLNVELDLWVQHLAQRAEAALAGSEVGVHRWCEIADDLLARRQPSMTDKEQQGLVGKGILRVQIAFGGGS